MRKLQLALTMSKLWLNDVKQRNQTGGVNSGKMERCVNEVFFWLTVEMVYSIPVFYS